MKKAKTLLSVLLSLILVLALGTSAYAAGTITVTDPGTYSYTAYQIFDAEENDGVVTYTLAAGSEWEDVLIDASGNSLFPGLTFTPDADPATQYTVVKGNTFSAADFAEFLRGEADANLSGKTAVTPGFGGDPLQASMDPGYYLVISEDGGVKQPKAALTTVLDGENVNIQNKNDMPFDKEVDGKKEEGVEVGQTVSFTLTGKVPSDIDAYTSYIYLISDSMDAGLTFNNDVAVTIGSAAVSPLTEITDPSEIMGGDQVRYAPYANGKSFELSLNLIGQTPDAEIVITYSAVVNSGAAGTVSENNAVLEYGNDPSELTVKDSQTKVYTSKLIIDKFENGEPSQKLSGAQFVLRKAGTKDYYFLNNEGVVSWVTTDPDTVADLAAAAASDITAFTTDDDGAAAFNGLADGEYELIEIASPAGYTRIETPIAVTIDGSASTSVGLSPDQITLVLTKVVNVANTSGTNLPSTGGIGTTIFYLVGSVFLAGAVVVLIVRKRRSDEA